jgi:hypothetical protein
MFLGQTSCCPNNPPILLADEQRKSRLCFPGKFSDFKLTNNGMMSVSDKRDHFKTIKESEELS